VRIPEPLPTATMLSARATDFSSVGMKAPLPVLTSITSASRPAASFLDRIEPVIMAIDSTVAVTSRTAYTRLSAGASCAVWPMMATPTSRTTSRRVCGSGAT